MGIKANIYLAILVWNELAEPTDLKLRAGRAPILKEKRQRFPLSLPINLRKDGAARAKKAGGTFTALLEALAERDMAKGGDLVIVEVDE